jgi:uncharacterized protein YbjT (DUF2867 family)
MMDGLRTPAGGQREPDATRARFIAQASALVELAVFLSLSSSRHYCVAAKARSEDRFSGPRRGKHLSAREVYSLCSQLGLGKTKGPEGNGLRRFVMSMKIVVIGGTGLIGSKVVEKLKSGDQEAVAAAPDTGVNTLTGEGLAKVLKGASVVVDVSNSPSWEDNAVMNFFETSTRNLLAYEATAGVGHHVALSVVGSERMLESGYFRAKIAQETLIKSSSIPYSIVRATQFFEFLKGIADISTEANTIRLPPALIQPMAAEDVAGAVCRVALGSPVNGTVEIGGPEKFRLYEWVQRGLAAHKDPREVFADPQARYYGIKVSDTTLIPGGDARLGETRFEDWLSPAMSAK